MLEEHYHAQLHQLLTEIPCDVELPDNWKPTYFDEHGVAKPSLDERRRFARHAFRTKAVLEIETSLPAIERSAERVAVLLRDVSRNGVGFLHAEQLFPNERCRLWLPTNLVPINVLCCRQFNPRCYLIGAQFVESDEVVTS